jgi:hypothetical protein
MKFDESIKKLEITLEIDENIYDSRLSGFSNVKHNDTFFMDLLENLLDDS